MKLNPKPVKRSLGFDKYAPTHYIEEVFTDPTRDLSSLTKEMENYINFQYYASLYIGDNDTQLDFLFDTGSDYLWIPLNNCTQ